MMNDGKLNYERERARKEMSDQISDARKIREDRESALPLVFIGACLLVAGGKAHNNDAAKDAKKIYDAAKKEVSQ